MNHEERKETFREGMTILDLKQGDTIYIKKLEAGYDYHYECEFEKVERGIIHAKILNCDRRELNGGFRRSLYPSKITARKTSCYLWGKGKTNEWAGCHWLKKDGRFD